jgi:hypothetical protein
MILVADPVEPWIPGPARGVVREANDAGGGDLREDYLGPVVNVLRDRVRELRQLLYARDLAGHVARLFHPAAVPAVSGGRSRS